MTLVQKSPVLMGVMFCIGMLATSSALSQTESEKHQAAAKERARTLLSKQLPAFDGTRLKATLVEVRYGPGEESRPHSHPCAVMGYVTEGTLRFQVEGGPLTNLQAGESFYEAPNVAHLVSANASEMKPASFVAYLLCDRDAPLSSETPSAGTKEDAQ